MATAADKLTERDYPEGWQVIPLSNVVSKARQRNPLSEPDREFEYVDVSSVSNDTLRIENSATLVGKDAPSRARKEIITGDVIFATVRPSLKRVALVPKRFNNQICSTGYCVLRANVRMLDSNYLYFVAISDDFVNRVSAHQKGSSYPAVRDSDVISEWIPLPPLPEQKAIAEVLRTVQRAKEATEKVIAATRQLKASLMKHLFTCGPVPFDQADQVPLKETEVGLIPEHWEVLPAAKLGAIQSGGTPSRKSPEFYGGNIPWVKTLDLNNSIVTATEELITQEGLAAIRGRIRPMNTVMVAMYGGAGTIGKCGILGIEAATNQAVCCIEPIPSACEPIYLFYYMTFIRSAWMKFAIGTRKDPNISKGIVERMLIPVAPKNEQVAVGQILGTLDDKIRRDKEYLLSMDLLFSASLSALMSGKVRMIRKTHT